LKKFSANKLATWVINWIKSLNANLYKKGFFTYKLFFVTKITYFQSSVPNFVYLEP